MLKRVEFRWLVKKFETAFRVHSEKVLQYREVTRIEKTGIMPSEKVGVWRDIPEVTADD